MRSCGERARDVYRVRLVVVLASAVAALGSSTLALQGNRPADRLAPGVFLYSIPQMRDLAMFGAFILFAIHPAFALLAILAVAAVIGALAWWETRRVHPPGV